MASIVTQINSDADYVTVSVNGLDGDDSYPRISGGNTDSVWENVSMSIVGRPSGVYQLLGFLVGNYNEKKYCRIGCCREYPKMVS